MKPVYLNKSHLVHYRWVDQEAIRKMYGLHALTNRELAETNNIIASIQTIRYLNEGILTQTDTPNEIISVLAKDCITLTYAVIEAIYIAASYKIQSACQRCPKYRCPFRSDSVYNAVDSFQANQEAPKYMQRTHITNPYTPALKALRDQRHDVHIIKQSETIFHKKDMVVKQAQAAHDLLEKTLLTMSEEMRQFIRHAGCPIPE
jgi:hypothetical protein